MESSLDVTAFLNHCNTTLPLFMRLNNIKDKWKVNQDRTFELEKIVEEIKKKGSGKEFDCILGLSGGADSSYMLHTIVKKFDLKPLVFHVDGGWNSEIAVSNIKNLVEKLGLDLFTEVINWKEMKDFQLAMFKSGVPHIDIPQDMAFIAVLYKFAKKYNIPYILNGGNISTECVQRPLDIIYWGTDMRHIKDILKKFSNNKMETFPFSSAFYHKLYLRYPDISNKEMLNNFFINSKSVFKYIKMSHMKRAIQLFEEDNGGHTNSPHGYIASTHNIRQITNEFTKSMFFTLNEQDAQMVSNELSCR